MPREKAIFTRLGKLGDDQGRVEEYERWDELGDEARYTVAWELVIQAFQIQGRDLDELRFQRSVENLVRKWG